MQRERSKSQRQRGGESKEIETPTSWQLTTTASAPQHSPPTNPDEAIRDDGHLNVGVPPPPTAPRETPGSTSKVSDIETQITSGQMPAKATVPRGKRHILCPFSPALLNSSPSGRRCLLFQLQASVKTLPWLRMARSGLVTSRSEQRRLFETAIAGGLHQPGQIARPDTASVPSSLADGGVL